MKIPLVLLTALFIASAHQTLSGETSGDWTYSVSDNQATITGYSGAGGAVDIPAVMNEISVVRVGQYSSIFGDGNSTVTSVTIPNGVTIIGEDAFFRCRSLASITIPEGVTSIGNSAFRSCTSLASITIPEQRDEYWVCCVPFLHQPCQHHHPRKRDEYWLCCVPVLHQPYQHHG